MALLDHLSGSCLGLVSLHHEIVAKVTWIFSFVSVDLGALLIISAVFAYGRSESGVKIMLLFIFCESPEELLPPVETGADRLGHVVSSGTEADYLSNYVVPKDLIEYLCVTEKVAAY